MPPGHSAGVHQRRNLQALPCGGVGQEGHGEWTGSEDTGELRML